MPEVVIRRSDITRNIETLPDNIKELIINQNNIDFFPQYNSAVLKDEQKYQVLFEVPYKEPPIVIVIPQRRNAPAREPQGWDIPEAKISIDPPKLTAIESIKVSLPTDIGIGDITIPPLEIPEIPKISIDTIKALGKKVAVTIEQAAVDFTETIKSKLDFPDLPVISAWNVDWKLMNGPGVFGKSIIAAGSVTQPNVPDPDSGQSGITTSAGETPTATTSNATATSEETPTEQPVDSTSQQRLGEDSPEEVEQGEIKATRYQRPKFGTSLAVIHEENTDKVDIGTEPLRHNGQFTGAFNFDFATDVFGGIKRRIGFQARATLVVPDKIKVLFTIGGSEGYRVWVDGRMIVNSWFNKSLIATTVVEREFEPGTYSLLYEWYVWDNYPACFFSTVPPFLPKIGRMEFDLENAMEMAYVGSWFFIRDNINSLMRSYLPIWTVSLPSITFPAYTIFNGISFTVSIPKLSAGTITVYKGKSWTLTIPKLGIPRFKIIGNTVFKLDVAAPFVALNNAFYNLLSIFPRWFGRFSGRQVGKYISSGLNSALDVARGAFDSMKGMGTSIIQYVNQLVKGVEKQVNETVENLKDSVNAAVGDTIDKVSSATTKAMNEIVEESTKNINTVATLISQKVTNALGVSSEAMMKAVEKQVNLSLENIISEFNAKLRETAVVMSKATNLAVNSGFDQALKNIDTKINELNIKTAKVVETNINESVSVLTKRVNAVLNLILPEVFEAMGLDPKTAITQANFVSASREGFILEGLKGGVRVNWIAIGTPDLKDVPSRAINLITDI